MPLVLALAACGGGVEVGPAEVDPATTERQAQAFVEALKPRRDGVPVIAVLARNEGTEITDFVLTHAVLQRSGVAKVVAVAPRRGRVSLYPALAVEVASDLASFDRAHPAGADYVIVPALDDANMPAINAWLKQQAARGARIIGVCAGALILGHAGLLDGRRFVTHWYFVDAAVERHETAQYVPHQRFVVDRDVATTTGITASVPAMLSLVEAIGGRAKAEALGSELGVASWSPVHDSSRFGLNASRRLHYIVTKLAFWRRDDLRIDAHDGMDDIALAFAADAWMRTGRATVEAVAAKPVTLRSGLVLLARPGAGAEASVPLPISAAGKPVEQLDRTLCEIGERYGAASREQVMVELE
jgi:putative intracellular protease/amidase